LSLRQFLPIACACIAWPVAAAAAPEDPEVLIARARAAVHAPAGPAAVELDGTIRARGLDGRWRRVVDLKTGDAAETADFGLFRTPEAGTSAAPSAGRPARA
jgi:hypothetical protein